MKRKLVNIQPASYHFWGESKISERVSRPSLNIQIERPRRGPLSLITCRDIRGSIDSIVEIFVADIKKRYPPLI